MKIPDLNRLRLPYKDEDINKDSIQSISIDYLNNIVSSIYPILNTEIRPDARKISFLGNKAFYISPYYYVESNIKTPNMTLRMKDAEFIIKLAKYYKSKNILLYEINTKVPRILLKIENINYIFITRKCFYEQPR